MDDDDTDADNNNNYETKCNYLLYGGTVSPLDRLRQHLYSDSKEFDLNNVPIPFIDENMERCLHQFETDFDIRLPDEIYEIFALSGISQRIKSQLHHDIILPDPTRSTSRYWIPLQDPPDNMDFAFMIICDEAKQYCGIVCWKHDWGKTGVMYGCRYSNYKQYLRQQQQDPRDSEVLSTKESAAQIDEDGFIPTSNRRRQLQKKSNAKQRFSKLTLEKLVDSNGKKMTFTTFLLSLVAAA